MKNLRLLLFEKRFIFKNPEQKKDQGAEQQSGSAETKLNSQEAVNAYAKESLKQLFGNDTPTDNPIKELYENLKELKDLTIDNYSDYKDKLGKGNISEMFTQYDLLKNQTGVDQQDLLTRKNQVNDILAEIQYFLEGINDVDNFKNRLSEIQRNLTKNSSNNGEMPKQVTGTGAEKAESVPETTPESPKTTEQEPDAKKSTPETTPENKETAEKPTIELIGNADRYPFQTIYLRKSRHQEFQAALQKVLKLQDEGKLFLGKDVPKTEEDNQFWQLLTEYANSEDPLSVAKKDPKAFKGSILNFALASTRAFNALGSDDISKVSKLTINLNATREGKRTESTAPNTTPPDAPNSTPEAQGTNVTQTTPETDTQAPQTANDTPPLTTPTPKNRVSGGKNSSVPNRNNDKPKTATNETIDSTPEYKYDENTILELARQIYEDQGFSRPEIDPAVVDWMFALKNKQSSYISTDKIPTNIQNKVVQIFSELQSQTTDITSPDTKNSETKLPETNPNNEPKFDIHFLGTLKNIALPKDARIKEAQKITNFSKIDQNLKTEFALAILELGDEQLISNVINNVKEFGNHPKIVEKTIRHGNLNNFKALLNKFRELQNFDESNLIRDYLIVYNRQAWLPTLLTNVNRLKNPNAMRKKLVDREDLELDKQLLREFTPDVSTEVLEIIIDRYDSGSEINTIIKPFLHQKWSILTPAHKKILIEEKLAGHLFAKEYGYEKISLEDLQAIRKLTHNMSTGIKEFDEAIAKKQSQ